MTITVRFDYHMLRASHRVEVVADIDKLAPPCWQTAISNSWRPSVYPEMKADVFIVKGNRRRQINGAMKEKVLDYEDFWIAVYDAIANQEEKARQV